MSKRLSDTEVWKKSWFFDLPDKYKLFWFYILSDCDAAGIWTANFKIAKAYLGELDLDKLIDAFKGQVTILNDGSYWLINDFIKFQYGYPIKEIAPMFKKIDTLLKQRNLSINTLYDTVYHTVYDTVKDKDKEEDKVKVEEKEDPEIEKWEKIIINNYSQLLKLKEPLTYEQHLKLVERYGKKAVTLVYERMHNWPELTKKRVSANLTAQTFLKQDNPNL